MKGTGQKSKAGIWLMALLMVVSACNPLAALAAQEDCEGPGWESPEEAVSVYLDGLKGMDIRRMISAYAVETYVDNYDLSAQVARMASYYAQMTPRLPNTNAIARGINIEARRNQIVQAAFCHLNMICVPEMDFTQPIPFTGENRETEAAAFVEQLDSAYGAVDFGTLELVGFRQPEELSELYASERNRENMKEQAAPLRAEETRSMIALFIVDGKVGVLCCDVVRYGDRWYMLQTPGNIGHLIGFAAHTAGMAVLDLEDVRELRDELNEEQQQRLDALLAEIDADK